MINLDNMTISHLRQPPAEINSFEVWWQTPFGLVATLVEAQALFSVTPSNWHELIKSVPVACSFEGDKLVSYEVLP